MRCERAAEQHEDLAGAGMDGGPAVTAKYRPASVTIDNNNTLEDTRLPSDPGYHYEKVQVGYTFTRGAWRCYAARHTYHEALIEQPEDWLVRRIAELLLGLWHVLTEVCFPCAAHISGEPHFFDDGQPAPPDIRHCLK